MSARFIFWFLIAGVLIVATGVLYICFPILWNVALNVAQLFNYVATVGIAGFGLWIAYQAFLRTPVQKPQGTKSEVKGEGKIRPIELVLFETRKQRTTLEVEESGLVRCELLDKSTREHPVQWKLGKEEIEKVLKENDIKAHAGYKLKTGLLNVGSHRNWLYSKDLFYDEETIEYQVQQLLETARDWKSS